MPSRAISSVPSPSVEPWVSHPRKSWPQICAQAEYWGRWVALDDCEYDEHTGQATLGTIVDIDADLAELCSRIRDSERKSCAIVFVSRVCEGTEDEPRRKKSVD